MSEPSLGSSQLEVLLSEAMLARWGSTTGRRALLVRSTWRAFGGEQRCLAQAGWDALRRAFPELKLVVDPRPLQICDVQRALDLGLTFSERCPDDGGALDLDTAYCERCGHLPVVTWGAELGELARLPGLAPERVILAAYLGHGPSREILGPSAPRDASQGDPWELLQGLVDWEPVVLQRAALAATRCAMDVSPTFDPRIKPAWSALARCARFQPGWPFGWALRAMGHLDHRGPARQSLALTRRTFAPPVKGMDALNDHLLRARDAATAAVYATVVAGSEAVHQAIRRDLLAWALGRSDPLAS
jgi:hypothetical protein